jgi:hypothetical protein
VTVIVMSDSGDKRESYRIQSEMERALLGQCERETSVIPMVCGDGHVHLVLENSWIEIMLTPEQAEGWVEALYDAAQEAKEASNE